MAEKPTTEARYNPELIEDWVVGSMGFWRKGEVNTDRKIVDFRGTWEEVKNHCDEMRALEAKHSKEQDELATLQKIEWKALWSVRGRAALKQGA